MGWDGKSHCWYCGADLWAILNQQDGHEQEYGDGPRSFEWHMQGQCLCHGYHIEIRHGGEEYHIKTPPIPGYEEDSGS